MGMDASQAKLLQLTARMHDVEFKAQAISNEKLHLATQRDDVYREYCDALDAKKIQVAFESPEGSRSYVDATFANMCGYNKDYKCKQYSLKDAESGKVIVNLQTANAYENFNTDKYAFAYAMLGLGDAFGWNDETSNCGTDIGIGAYTGDFSLDFDADQSMLFDSATNSLFMTEVEGVVFNNHKDSDERLKDKYNSLVEACGKDDMSTQDKQKVLNTFRDYLYDTYGSEIYKYMRLDKQVGYDLSDNRDPDASDAEFYGGDICPSEFPKDEFYFYVHLFEEIQAAGGCQVIPSGYETGNEGNNWLNNVISTGRVVIDYYDEARKCWTETTVGTSTNKNFLIEGQDAAAIKKAETKYEYELKKISQKDSKYNQDLSKLETERTSIKTEMDSIKKVKDDNIERTFGIFS